MARTIAPPRRSIEARNALVVANLGLVNLVVGRCNYVKIMRLGKDEATQAGVMGLIRAASYWDDTRGIQFSTYAYRSIATAVWEALRRNSVVAPPRKRPKSEAGRAAADRTFRVCGLPPSDGWHPTTEERTEADHDEAERQQSVRAAVSGLSADCRRLLDDKLTQGLELREIAARYGCSRTTVVNRWNEIVEEIRERVGAPRAKKKAARRAQSFA